MSKRFGWLLGVVVLVTIGLLVACGSSYNPSSDGLVLVGSQGSGLVETFSFNLFNGHVSAIANPPADTASKVCVLNGVPTSMVVNPAGTFAYAIIIARSDCPSSKTGILTFKINSNGTTTVVGDLVRDPNPVALSIDAAGKFLFVAQGLSGIVDVYKIDSSAGLTAAPAKYTFPPTTMVPNIVAMAATPTVFPSIGINGVQNSVCSAPGLAPPTTQYLYAVDAQNYVVWEFSMDTASGALGNPSPATLVPSYATDPVPAGIAVDPCNRFVYVSDSLTNKVSAYAICNGSPTQSSTCSSLNQPGGLVPVSGSPFSLSGSTNPGPLVVDPYGNNVYVLGLDSNTVSPLKISPISGSLTPLSPATVATGLQPVAMTIRGDDNWLFVSNYNAATVSQYSITPATGQLSVQPPIPTDNYPFGVAVK